MIDTHTHLYLSDSYTEQEAETCVKTAEALGVDKLIMPGINDTSLKPLAQMQSKFPNNVFLALGLHPCDVDEDYSGRLATIKRGFESMQGVVAVGEIGIDLYHDTTKQNLQIAAFVEQLKWAKQLGLPVILHQRAALDITLEILKTEYTEPNPGIVFHCFTDDAKAVERIRTTLPNAYFGIGGVCTFKNARELRQSLHEIGIEHILLETDSPYLAPTPHRGKRNQSAYIPLIASAIATELGMSMEAVSTQTDANAHRLFPNLKPD